ncbi:MAG TPA: site-2 protease family protein [Patescibacteria group bacterium]|nr:site-2 protease family protein [Patescibacteria group bacterium]
MFGFDPDMLFRIPALLIALTFHEYAHARVANALGDPTARMAGRLTLNPIAHLDPIGLLMLWLFKFGWAKPVPVNPSYFRNEKQGMLLVSLAGPASNILLAFSTAVVIELLFKFHVLGGGLGQILQLTYIYNILLAIFNLLPIPPLDGAKILSSLLPGRQAYAFESLDPYGPFILMGLVYLGVVSMVTNPLEHGLHLFISSVVQILF